MPTFTIENWQNVEDSDRLSIVVIISLYVFFTAAKKNNSETNDIRWFHAETFSPMLIGIKLVWMLLLTQN